MEPVYNKPPLLIKDQASLLFQRGLQGISKPELEKILHKVSYYRLSGYFYPYQDKNTNNFTFNNDWNIIWQDYLFDSKLRIFLFNAISYIEITFRTQLIYCMSVSTNDSRWYENCNNFFNQKHLNEDLTDLLKCWDRSKEQFKNHYNTCYDSSLNPPAWMIFETATFGTISKYFENLTNALPGRVDIAKYFGFTKSSTSILCSWLKNLNLVRNICAHHSRLFSKVLLSKPKLVSTLPWSNTVTNRDSIYTSICIIGTLIKYCEVDFNYKKGLKELLKNANKNHLLRMGFPANFKI